MQIAFNVVIGSDLFCTYPDFTVGLISITWFFTYLHMYRSEASNYLRNAGESHGTVEIHVNIGEPFNIHAYASNAFQDAQHI